MMTALQEKHSELGSLPKQKESLATHPKVSLYNVKHTRGLKVDNFAMLLDIGVITLDYTLKRHRPAARMIGI